MFALFEAELQRNFTGPKPHAASLRSLHGANHVAPLRGAYATGLTGLLPFGVLGKSLRLKT